MKYIVIADDASQMMGTSAWPKGGSLVEGNAHKEMPLAFPEGIAHSILFEQLKKVYPGLRIVSAGFVTESEDGWFCEGRSSSLNIGSRGQIDANLFNRYLWVDL